MKIPETYIDNVLINETFHSIQGEGFHTGKSAFFIRFAGCDIGCKWCDSKDAWNPENSTSTPISKIVEESLKYKSDIVIITGGEPLVHDLEKLTEELRKVGKKVHLETSGAYELKASFDWLTLSPKRIFDARDELYLLANELKIIVSNEKDFDFCSKNEAKVNPDCLLYIQPQWGNQEKTIPVILDFIKDNPKWRLSLQTHKYLNIK